MKVAEQSIWKGVVRITVRAHRYKISDEEFYNIIARGELEKVTQLVKQDTIQNLVMLGGKNLLRNSMYGIVTDCKIKQLAWGTSSSAVNSSQTSLIVERGRRVVTKQTPQTDGVLLTQTYMSPSDGAGLTLQELGWFAGSGATAAVNSGTMISRILYSHLKTNLESIQVERTDTIA